ncbi:MAG: fasciclin domain-containing protein [Rhodospirillaceae bacterium]|nr:fasciclin domain-containing protein [Rhodospirillaceae bacterium]
MAPDTVAPLRLARRAILASAPLVAPVIAPATAAMVAGFWTAPAWARNIVDLAAETGSFKTLIRALEVAELKDSLVNEGPFTLFAPTDDAFTKIPQATLDNLMRPENRDQLVMLLKHHVLAGRVISRDYAGRRLEALPLDGGAVILDARQKPKIGPARIVRADMLADNGIVHVIDQVLVPASFAEDPAMADGAPRER